MKKTLSAGLAVGIFMFGMAGAASADLLFDRGLPSANLNNAAGADRSNVAWKLESHSSKKWLAGDDFSFKGAGKYQVDTISIWAVGGKNNSNLSLWLGEAGGKSTKYSSFSSKSVTYGNGNGDTYQGSSGKLRGLTQYDFNINTVLNGAANYQFFLDGCNTYLHASNAFDGGTLAEGADDKMLFARASHGGLKNIGEWSSNGWGWNKGSDANIQVFGSQQMQPVPEPATMLLIGTGIAGLAGVRHRRKKS